ncbi:MAG: DUF1013 domain-containing protein [Alphaproteobacteria bacterium GM202ARS2]|nr:DUF1013 domain-containing protein [Alphaproteobacteria bacterium GM202ARS2]
MEQRPLMPKATAIWLIDNTTLTFEQIGAFVGLHTLEVQAIADGEVDSGIIGMDPVANKQLSWDEIKRCQGNNAAQLVRAEPDVVATPTGKRIHRYTPISKRKHKIDAIAWLVRHRKDLKDGQICQLIGTTRSTIKSVREGKHWNMAEIDARSPVELGLCSIEAYNALNPKEQGGQDSAT